MLGDVSAIEVCSNHVVSRCCCKTCGPSAVMFANLTIATAMTMMLVMCVIMVTMLAMIDVHVSVDNGGVVESSRIEQ